MEQLRYEHRPRIFPYWLRKFKRNSNFLNFQKYERGREAPKSVHVELFTSNLYACAKSIARRKTWIISNPRDQPLKKKKKKKRKKTKREEKKSSAFTYELYNRICSCCVKSRERMIDKNRWDPPSVIHEGNPFYSSEHLRSLPSAFESVKRIKRA